MAEEDVEWYKQQVRMEQELNANKEVTLETTKEITKEQMAQQQVVEAQNIAQGKMNLLLKDTIFLMGKAYGASRDPYEIENASEEELKDLIAKNRREIELIESQKGLGPTAGADAATNFLMQGIVQSRLRTDINRAQFQVDQRRNIRNTVARFGESGARARFSGDPLKFDELLAASTVQRTEATKTVQVLQSLDDRLATAGFARR